jgi:hypothetical protein
MLTAIPIIRRMPQVMVFALAASLIATPVTAKDLKVLADFVAPAYTAMNFTVVCVALDPEFLAQTSGPRGHAIHYAEHVKDEAIVSLSNDEAVVALRAAADAARGTALQTLRPFHSPDPAMQAARIKAWCGNEARQFIRAFIEDHDNNHEGLLSKIEHARR